MVEAVSYTFGGKGYLLGSHVTHPFLKAKNAWVMWKIKNTSAAIGKIHRRNGKPK